MLSAPDVVKTGRSPESDPRVGYEPVEPGLWRRPRSPGPQLQWQDVSAYEWNEFLISIPELPAGLEGFRIVHLSDLHARAKWLTAYNGLVDRLAKDPPDLILFGGDLVEDPSHPHQALPTANRLLMQLQSRLGTFGIFGNHDRQLNPVMTAGTGMQWLDGRRVLVHPRSDTAVEIIGLPGPERLDLPSRFAESVPPKAPGVPRVVLSHYPDHLVRLTALQPDLFLSGHTHGGQMCLPGGWPILRHDSFPRRITRGGLFHRGDTWLLVNRGMGFSSFECRAFCPAEVVDLRLTRNE